MRYSSSVAPMVRKPDGERVVMMPAFMLVSEIDRDAATHSLVVPASEPGPIATDVRGYDRSSKQSSQIDRSHIWGPAQGRDDVWRDRASQCYTAPSRNLNL